MTKDELFQGFLRAEEIARDRGYVYPRYDMIAKAFGVLADEGENWKGRLEYSEKYDDYKDSFEYEIWKAANGY